MAPRQRLTPNPSSEERGPRSRSSSPSLNEKLNNDENSSTRQPPLTSLPLQLAMEKQAEIARDRHDIFNLIALVFVVGMTVINWNWYKFLQGKGPQEAWTGTYFFENWAMTALYFVMDLIWVAKVPICVKSPGIIIKHHLVAICYLSAPLAWPEYQWFMGACLSVEVNTWFLILRRVVYKRRDSIPPFVSDIVSWLFYVSWIIIRIIIYPAILVSFLQMAYIGISETKSIFHLQLLFIPIHFFLCILNLKWSYDLFKPIVQPWFTKEAPRVGGVSSGL